jgi:hypothetical protein
MDGDYICIYESVLKVLLHFWRIVQKVSEFQGFYFVSERRVTKLLAGAFGRIVRCVDWGFVLLYFMKFIFVNNFPLILLGRCACEHILDKSGYINLV